MIFFKKRERIKTFRIFLFFLLLSKTFLLRYVNTMLVDFSYNFFHPTGLIVLLYMLMPLCLLCFVIVYHALYTKLKNIVKAFEGKRDVKVT